MIITAGNRNNDAQVLHETLKQLSHTTIFTARLHISLPRISHEDTKLHLIQHGHGLRFSRAVEQKIWILLFETIFPSRPRKASSLRLVLAMMCQMVGVLRSDSSVAAPHDQTYIKILKLLFISLLLYRERYIAALYI